MAGYGDYCGVSKTAEILCERWTVLVLRELLAGSTRFSEIQRGLPACPPATLSKRLRTLERHCVVERSGPRPGSYELTEAGRELFPVVLAFGEWGQRWARSTYPDAELDADSLLWDIRRYLDPAGLGIERAVVQIDVRSRSSRTERFWFVVEAAGVDLCVVDPLRPVDAWVVAELRALVELWMGDITFRDAEADARISVHGRQPVVDHLPAWIGRHPLLGGIAPARP